jgi:hypothetical protein
MDGMGWDGMEEGRKEGRRKVRIRCSWDKGDIY